MEKSTNKRGVSLIVLGVTIIIMIILASVIILSLTKDEVIDKAEQAKSQNDLAVLKEACMTKQIASRRGPNKKTAEVILNEVVSELGMEKEFEGTKYIGDDKAIKQWVFKFIMEGAGYILSSVEGEMYVTRFEYR